jgi:hypothetical protein
MLRGRSSASSGCLAVTRLAVRGRACGRGSRPAAARPYQHNRHGAPIFVKSRPLSPEVRHSWAQAAFHQLVFGARVGGILARVLHLDVFEPCVGQEPNGTEGVHCVGCSSILKK